MKLYVFLYAIKPDKLSKKKQTKKYRRCLQTLEKVDINVYNYKCREMSQKCQNLIKNRRLTNSRK